jgi:hypothetical protein
LRGYLARHPIGARGAARQARQPRGAATKGGFAFTAMSIGIFRLPRCAETKPPDRRKSFAGSDKPEFEALACTLDE